MKASRSHWRIRPPAGLRAATLSVQSDEFMLLEWPLHRPEIPAWLTPAERRVVELLLVGLSNAEIARRRGRSPRTVANQVASAFRHLGVGSRLELFALASSGCWRRSREARP